MDKDEMKEVQSSIKEKGTLEAKETPVVKEVAGKTESQVVLAYAEAIEAKYEAFKTELGMPAGKTTSISDGWRKQKYEKNGTESGAIYYKAGVGTFVVYGAIYGRYNALDAEKGILGFPKTDEIGTPDGKGRYNHFEKGSIYWTELTGAREIHGPIYNKWASLGWEAGYLGYPISNEGKINSPAGKKGKFWHFEHGSIYYNEDKNLGPCAVHEKITARWGQSDLKWEQGNLGYPVNDTQGVTKSSISSTISNDFQGGRIVWHQSSGYVVQNLQEIIKELLQAKYKQFEKELVQSVGNLVALSDDWWKQEYNNNSGAIYVKQGMGAFVVYGAIYARYKKMKSEKGVLGFPKTDETGTPDGKGRYNHFENGSIYWTPATGACAITQIGEVTIPFSLDIQEPDLFENLRALDQKISSIDSKLNSLKTSYDAHTHSYERSYMGGAWNLHTLRESLNKGNNLDCLVRILNPDNMPSTNPTGSTSKPL